MPVIAELILGYNDYYPVIKCHVLYTTLPRYLSSRSGVDIYIYRIDNRGCEFKLIGWRQRNEIGNKQIYEDNEG